MSSSIVPLHELPTIPSEECNVGWQFPQNPNVTAGTIGMNVSRTQRIIRWAGFGAITIAPEVGETEHYELDGFNIDGINADGTAAGTGSMRMSVAKELQPTLKNDDKDLATEYRWPELTVPIDRVTLGSQTSDKVRKGASFSDAYAVALDHSLRSGMQMAIKNKLLSDLYSSREDAVFYACTGALTLACIDPPVTSLYEIPGIVSATLLATHALRLGWSTMKNVLATDDPLFTRRRWSILPFGVQPDRILAANILLNTKRLIRPIKQLDVSDNVAPS